MKLRTNRIIMCLIGSILLISCGRLEEKTEKVRDLEYTVIGGEDLPEELYQTLEEKKEQGFTISYEDGEDLYLCKGYGTKPTGGYSITVKEVYLTGNAIYFCTDLTGPDNGEKLEKVNSYPSIVVKTERMDKTIVFE